MALLTFRGMTELSQDDALLCAPLADAGYEPVVHVWDDPAVAWESFAAVIVRSVWDYVFRGEEFLAWVAARALAGVPLFNSPRLVRWNESKLYLAELAAAGVAIPRTHVVAPGRAVEPLRDALVREGWQRAVLKPVRSSGGMGVERIDLTDGRAAGAALEQALARGVTLLQEYLPGIEAEGEWSLVFFDGAYSHSVVKRPGDDDFRTQLVHGGTEHVVAAPAAAIAEAQRIVARLPEVPLYARVDFVRCGDRYLLIELELIEPVLFLGADPDAPRRFVRALAARIAA